jgi:lipoprotein NlpD
VQTGAIVMPPSDKPAPVVRKTEPRGDKKAYSESALAELQRRRRGKAASPAAARAAAGAAAAAVVPVPAARRHPRLRRPWTRKTQLDVAGRRQGDRHF